MRYTNNEIKKTFDGKQVYAVKINSNIEESTRDIIIATETGDRLDTLAFDYYGDPNKWYIIAAANKIHGANLGLKDGTVSRIPLLLPKNF